MMDENERAFEEIALADSLYLIELLDKDLYQKNKLMGDISASLGKAFGIDDYEFFLAGYYANISMLGISHSIRQKSNFSHKEMDVLKRHPYLSAQYVLRKGLKKTSQLIREHHELPDGTGYNKMQSYSIEANLLHIADMYVGLTTPRMDRLNSFYTGEEAWKIIEDKYKKSKLFESYKLETFQSVMQKFFHI